MTPALTRASRYISWALRHAPDEANIALDRHGWTSVRDLLHSLAVRGHAITPEELAAIVRDDAKGRFSFSDKGDRIRANNGHSVDVVPDVPPTIPPAVLFHGTARHKLTAIKRDGLVPMSRRFVHLVSDLATAFAVGARHGPPVVIVIDTQPMHNAGLPFYPMTQQVWLTAAVPPAYLRFDSLIFDADEPRPSSWDAENRSSDPLPTR